MTNLSRVCPRIGVGCVNELTFENDHDGVELDDQTFMSRVSENTVNLLTICRYGTNM